MEFYRFYTSILFADSSLMLKGIYLKSEFETLMQHTNPSYEISHPSDYKGIWISKEAAWFYRNLYPDYYRRKAIFKRKHLTDKLPVPREICF
jgi:hypothetical protein